MTNFEEKLNRLEQLSSEIKRSDISLEDALKDFEEGIKLAKGLEAELNKIEGKIQILMNEPNPSVPEMKPELDLFSGANNETGTAGAPSQGLRQDSNF
ncbi:MAG: exodeoxyribonuclease VII small subunit [Treponema sp.]|nr:exodeoxyribonuclease VII small subunit [Treponema sp.]